jgi:hypothetical protein
VITFDELRAEQREQWPSHRQNDDAGRERSPEGPADRIGENAIQPSVVAGDVIFAEAVSHRRRYGEMNEGDERQGLGRCVVDCDVVGRAEVLQHDDVDGGEQKVEALDMTIGSETENQTLVS